MLTIKTLEKLRTNKGYDETTRIKDIIDDCIELLTKKGLTFSAADRTTIHPLNLINITDLMETLNAAFYVFTEVLGYDTDSIDERRDEVLRSWIFGNTEIIIKAFSNTAVHISYLYKNLGDKTGSDPIIPIGEKQVDFAKHTTPETKVERYSVLGYACIEPSLSKNYIDKFNKKIISLYDQGVLPLYFPPEKIGAGKNRQHMLHDYYQWLFDLGVNPFPFIISGILNDVPAQYQYLLEHYFIPDKNEERRKNYHLLKPECLFDLLNYYVGNPKSLNIPRTGVSLATYSGWVGTTLSKFALTAYFSLEGDYFPAERRPMHLQELEDYLHGSNDYNVIAINPDPSLHTETRFNVKHGIHAFQTDGFTKKRRFKNITFLLKLMIDTIKEKKLSLDFGILTYYFREYRDLMMDINDYNMDQVYQELSETLLVAALNSHYGLAGIIPTIIPVETFWHCIFVGANDGNEPNFSCKIDQDFYFYHLEDHLHYFGEKYHIEINRKKFIFIMVQTCGCTVFTPPSVNKASDFLSGLYADKRCETYGEDKSDIASIQLLNRVYYRMCNTYGFDLLSRSNIPEIEWMGEICSGSLVTSRFRSTTSINVSTYKNPSIITIHQLLERERAEKSQS